MLSFYISIYFPFLAVLFFLQKNIYFITKRKSIHLFFSTDFPWYKQIVCKIYNLFILKILNRVLKYISLFFLSLKYFVCLLYFIILLHFISYFISFHFISSKELYLFSGSDLRPLPYPQCTFRLIILMLTLDNGLWRLVF